jgi:hypothetical protein
MSERQFPLDFHIDHKGHIRPLGLVPPLPGASTPASSFTLPLVPEVQWVEFDLCSDPSYPLKVKDQDSRGACNGHASAEAMELARWLHGQPHVPLSGWFPYAILCNGWDRGSSIGEALDLIQSKGLAPESDVKYGIIDPAKLTKQAFADALEFRCEVGAPLETWEQLMSAVQLKLGGLNLSIRVANVTWDPDSEGVVPLCKGAGNHAISAGHGAKKLKSGKWAIKWQNHWTDEWGQGGYAWLTQDHWDMQTYREAWVIRTPIENPADNSMPPIAA